MNQFLLHVYFYLKMHPNTNNTKATVVMSLELGCLPVTVKIIQSIIASIF